MATARDQIIETTCELIEMQGYHATGLNQIIKESGSPKGSLYYYFPGGKEELTTEAINHTGQIILYRIESSLAAIEDPAIAIRTFILAVAQNVHASGYRAGGPITTVALETATTSEKLSAECAKIYQAWQSAFANKLLKNGYSPEQAESLAATIIAALEGGIILSRSYKNVKSLENIAEQIGKLVAANK
jgi:TetR/AcrR family transcriptional repressor of lmrAB and yxaGH operons